MKRLLTACMVLLALAVFIGCSNKNETSSSGSANGKSSSSSGATPAKEVAKADTQRPAEKIPVRFMYWNKDESLAELVDLINTELPHVDFEFQFVDIASFQTVYKTQMTAGEGPDLLAIEHLPFEVEAGWVLDITNQPFINNYQESVVNELAVDGKSYAIPGPSWFGGYFYNKTFFDENGFEIPATYDEFLQLCDDIAALGVKPIANPIKNPNYLMHYALSFVSPNYLRQPEGMHWDKAYAEGTVTMAESWGPHLAKWAEIVENGHVTAQDLGMGFDQAMDEFVTGKAAMLDSGPWDVEIIKSKNPDMVIDMMPFVGNQGDTGWLFGGPGIRFGANALLAKKGNEAKLQAVLDIMALISTKEGQEAYWQNNQGGSSYVKGVEFPMPSEYDGCKEVFAEGHVYAPWTLWNPGVYEEFGKQLQAYVAGSATLQDVMDATDAKNEEILLKYAD